MINKRFMNAEDVALYMDIAIPTAYKVIRAINQELTKNGYVTVAGKVNRDVFEMKVNGGMKYGSDKRL